MCQQTIFYASRAGEVTRVHAGSEWVSTGQVTRGNSPPQRFVPEI